MRVLPEKGMCSKWWFAQSWEIVGADYEISRPRSAMFCHPSPREGSLSMGKQMLREARGDRTDLEWENSFSALGPLHAFSECTTKRARKLAIKILAFSHRI